MTIKIIKTVEDIRNAVRTLKAEGKKVALVPTMGGLHAGHLSLVKRAEDIADVVIVSIFVNPKQFNQESDLKEYPGTMEEDLTSLSKTKTNIVYMPSVEEMYPNDFTTLVKVERTNQILCDIYRPGHFAGVSTIVSKLFIQTEADIACFGEKDYQQLRVVRQMAKDLNIPIHIEPVETVREKDGLAMSSRNARLTQEEREIAPLLHQAMQDAAASIRDGETIENACKQAIANLTKSNPFKVEYFEVRSGDDMRLLDNHHPSARLFAAAWLGDVRLIDNIGV